MMSFGDKLKAATGVADATTAVNAVLADEARTLAMVTTKPTDVTNRLLVLLMIEQRRTNQLLAALLDRTGQ
jgi:voltage-gated potassium channel Kch